MKKNTFSRFVFAFAAITSGICATAQEKTDDMEKLSDAFTASASYRYLNAPNWDTIILNYNFARPFLTELQPLLTHGFEIAGGYRKPFGNFHLEARMAYGHTASVAENNDRRFKIAINNLDLQAAAQVYVLPFLDKKANAGKNTLYLELAPALSLFMPSVREDRKQIQLNDDKKYHPLTLAFQLGISAGYEIKLPGKMILAPFGKLQWYPNARLGDFAAAVHGTYLTGLSDESSAVLYSGGFRVIMGR